MNPQDGQDALGPADQEGGGPLRARSHKIVTVMGVVITFKKSMMAEVTKAMRARRKMASMAKPKKRQATTALVNTSWRRERVPKGGMTAARYVQCRSWADAAPTPYSFTGYHTDYKWRVAPPNGSTKRPPRPGVPQQERGAHKVGGRLRMHPRAQWGVSVLISMFP